MGNSNIDRISFILGMITAFAECVANECKRVAFSPPFRPHEYQDVYEEAQQIAEEQNVFLWHEKNNDIPPDHRLHWLVIYKFPEALEQYLSLRNQGLNPVWDLEQFYGILSYGLVWAEGVDKITPRFREYRATRCTFSRILLLGNQWPVPK